jgi:hypothetical protein
MDTVDGAEDVMIVAEDAPLDVQLWPTTSPDHADNFTLKSVAVVRAVYGRQYVEWTYFNGTTRQFSVGERIACRIATS